MSSGLWYVAAGRDREPKDVQPTPPVELDYTWLVDFLEDFHNPSSYNGDPNMGTVANSHAEQIRIYRQEYEAQISLPWRDGLIYYDPAGNAMHAYYFKEAIGQGLDQRWLDYADDAGTFWHLAAERRQYTTATGVYHFPAGLWLCQDAGIALTPAEFTANADQAIQTFYGNTYYNNTTSHENMARYSARLFEWMLYYYRVVGHNHPNYKTDDNKRGQRYHWGQSWQQHHLYEWLDEWHDDPLYPGVPPYTDPIDYANRAVDAGNPNGNAIFLFGPFMSQFCYQSNMQLWNEDANYQQQARLDYVQRMVDFNHEEGWYPASGTPGNTDEFGAWGYYYTLCGDAGTGENPITTAYCQSLNPGKPDWAIRRGPSRELSGFHLEALAWLWRQTGDSKYSQWYVDTWEALRQMYRNGDFNYFVRDYRGGKQANQILLRIFNAIVLRGDYSFKTAGYPTGTWPYPTPPQVSPDP